MPYTRTIHATKAHWTKQLGAVKSSDPSTCIGLLESLFCPCSSCIHSQGCQKLKTLFILNEQRLHVSSQLENLCHWTISMSALFLWVYLPHRSKTNGNWQNDRCSGIREAVHRDYDNGGKVNALVLHSSTQHELLTSMIPM